MSVASVPPVTIAVAGGKGGVGKTTVSANLAISMAQSMAPRHSQVAAIDMDLGSGNLNTCLGVALPNGSINDFLFDRVDRLDSLWNQTPVENLRLICGSYRGTEVVDFDEEARSRLFDELRQVTAAAVLLDMGAGSASDVIDGFVRADQRVVVIAPESLSLHNGFLFMKSAIFRYLDHELQKERFLYPIRRKLKAVVAAEAELSLDQVLGRIKGWDRYSAYILEGLLNEFDLKWVINMYRGGEEDLYLQRFGSLVGRRLGLDAASCLGRVEFDDDVRRSAQDIKPFYLQHPDSLAAQGIRRIAAKLIDDGVEPQEGPPLKH